MLDRFPITDWWLRQSDRQDGGSRTSNAAFGAKLLGDYERELHPLLERIAARDYDRIVDVGCSEGYYAVGLARTHPRAAIAAFDVDHVAQSLCRQLARCNGVDDRIEIRAAATFENLQEVLAKAQRALVVMDCEGCDVLVECHDAEGAPVTEPLLARFDPTHRIERIEEGGRDPNRHPAIAVLPFNNLSGDPEQEYFADGILPTATISRPSRRWRRCGSCLGRR